MKWEKNVLCILGIYEYNKPETILYRVLTDFNKTEDTPWPLFFSNGFCTKVLRKGKQINHKDCLMDKELFMTHSLWTCDCNPDEGHTVIHVSPANACIDCRRRITDFNQQIKYFHEELKYEPKAYEYNEEEGMRLASVYFDFIEQPPENKGFFGRFFQ